MGTAADKLTALVADPERFAFSADDLRETQIAALDERFRERRDRIRLLGLRARDAAIEGIARIEDVVPVLFPHTAYKSYPESYLMDERWDRLTKWLGTVSTHPIEGVDLDGIEGIDDWIARLAQQGHFISCSSGTTGKSAMLIASHKDMEWSKIDTVNVFSWGSGVVPAQDRLIIGCAPVATVPKNTTIARAQYDAFANPEWPRWNYPVPPITVGSLTAMVVMRKKIAEGTARPDEIAAFEETSARRATLVADAVPATAQFIIENRHRKLQLSGLWSGLWQVARAVRDAGYGREDFNADNSIYVGGGLKRAQLPADYQDYVFETFNIPADRHFQNYSMQELNSGMPKCREGGRYHVPPWIVPVLLDKSGDEALGSASGEREGRAAFFDLSLDGRWGGVITGDRISLDCSPCACGNHGPSIRDDIVRYADLEGDDKIGCAGTVDAYVRGVA
ncbi:hypothetical protein [Novosphingobium guangzhouense]|uniref:Acyl-protein synthetase LuxE domain-containing protein n=1 Tax=Novosphingobium guangzhouense TaxID=1850347 RepID=A0A2K2G5D7_9SPHN|nr:hypothetical protein [Novosphingobium guangzhouense]PNU06249.1 hypothetical protein A8V01_12945 [Novosphingobium guangzhouense]